MKKLLSIVLALALILGACAMVSAEGKYYGGYDDMIEASIAIYQRSNQGAAENIWWWDFCREYFGINFTKIDQLTETGTYKSVAFASGDMPDVFYQLFLGTSALVEQGTVNGNLVELDKYITPELTPNLCRIYEAHPEYKAAITAGDGHIYSLGCIQNANGAQQTFYINQRWLDDAGLAVPTTLDEFTAAMAAFKARESLPENEGKVVVPLTGDLGNQPRYIANAMGWITDNAGYLTSIALKNDTPLFIYADEELFPEFMKIMKEYIDLGYFSADVFDDQYAGNQTAAQKANDLTGFDQNTSNAIDATEWTAAIPLTSKWNDTHATGRSYTAINNASFAIASTCSEEKIERLMVWVDWLYDYNNYLMSHWGPSAEEPEYWYGLKGGYTSTWDETKNAYVFTCPEVTDGDYNTFGDYQNQRIQGIIGGYLGLNVDLFGECTRTVSPTVYKNHVDTNVLPYLVDMYPNIRFFDADVTLRTAELATDINSYVNEKYVAFISGDVEMTEENLADYFAGLKALNYDEYVGYYIDYYETYKANK